LYYDVPVKNNDASVTNDEMISGLGNFEVNLLYGFLFEHFPLRVFGNPEYLSQLISRPGRPPLSRKIALRLSAFQMHRK
jgi:hypothetical protein